MKHTIIYTMNNLKALRTQKGMSQSKLAELSCLSQNTISDLENNKGTCNVNHALWLARALDCKVENIFYLKTEERD